MSDKSTVVLQKSRFVATPGEESAAGSITAHGYAKAVSLVSATTANAVSPQSPGVALAASMATYGTVKNVSVQSPSTTVSVTLPSGIGLIVVVLHGFVTITSSGTEVDSVNVNGTAAPAPLELSAMVRTTDAIVRPTVPSCAGLKERTLI